MPNTAMPPTPAPAPIDGAGGGGGGSGPGGGGAGSNVGGPGGGTPGGGSNSGGAPGGNGGSASTSNADNSGNSAVQASDASAGPPVRVVRMNAPPPRVSLTDIWFNQLRPGQKRQLIIVLPARGGGNSAITLRTRESLEATLLDQAFVGQVAGGGDASFVSLDAEEVRRNFSDLIDDPR